MMKNMKHLLAALTSAAMLMSTMVCAPMSTSADTDLTYGSLVYVNQGDYIEITDCDTSVTTVEIPAEIDGLPVTSVDAYAFEYCESLASITVEAGNTSYCSVDGILFSADKTVLVEYPQAKAGDTYTVPAGVTELGEYCFSNTALQTVTVPTGVTTVGSSAFDDCMDLVTLNLPEGLTTIGSNAFSFCYALTDLQIPSTVTSIGGWAFCYCSSLTEVILPEGLVSVGPSVVMGCAGLTSITIPTSLTELSYTMFINCESLKEVYLPSSITTISGQIFSGCSSVTDVYYDGLESDWDAISISEDNEELFACTIHFSDGSKTQGSAAAVPTGLGDLNGDSVADASDAAMILVAAASVGAGVESGLTAEQESAADANADGIFNAVDAAYILQYGAAVGSGNTEASFADWYFHLTSNQIFWDSNGVFGIDYSLLGMTYEEICTTLRLEMSEPEAWTYWGTDLTWSSTNEFALPSVNFMFQDGVCRMIYNDQDRSYTTDMQAAVAAVYGGDNDVVLNGGSCTYSAYAELYLENGEYYLRQEFVSSDMR